MPLTCLEKKGWCGVVAEADSLRFSATTCTGSPLDDDCDPRIPG